MVHLVSENIDHTHSNPYLLPQPALLKICPLPLSYLDLQRDQCSNLGSIIWAVMNLCQGTSQCPHLSQAVSHFMVPILDRYGLCTPAQAGAEGSGLSVINGTAYNDLCHQLPTLVLAGMILKHFLNSKHWLISYDNVLCGFLDYTPRKRKAVLYDHLNLNMTNTKHLFWLLTTKQNNTLKLLQKSY